MKSQPTPFPWLDRVMPAGAPARTLLMAMPTGNHDKLPYCALLAVKHIVDPLMLLIGL